MPNYRNQPEHALAEQIIGFLDDRFYMVKRSIYYRYYISRDQYLNINFQLPNDVVTYKAVVEPMNWLAVPSYVPMPSFAQKEGHYTVKAFHDLNVKVATHALDYDESLVKRMALGLAYWMDNTIINQYLQDPDKVFHETH